MKKVIVSIVYFLILFIPLAASVEAVILRPGEQVIDNGRLTENHATFLQTATIAVNTATQIANQVINLASMSPEAMLAHILGVEKQLGQVVDIMKQAQGLMDATQTAEQAWNRTFKQIDSFAHGETSAADRIAHHEDMINVLDQTYQDALRVGKLNTEIDSDTQQLQDMMNENQNAVGNKTVKQVKNQAGTLVVAQKIKQNETLPNLTTVLVASARANLEIAAEARSNAFHGMNINVSDPYQPTKDDLKNYTKPAGQGYIHFF